MLFDKRLLTPCPVLTPTDQEFNDPVGYLSSDKVSKLGATYGLVKIVPPPNWKPSFHINLTLSSMFGNRYSVIWGLQPDLEIFQRKYQPVLKMRRKRQLKLYFNVQGTRVYYYDLYREVENLGEPMDKENGKS